MSLPYRVLGEIRAVDAVAPRLVEELAGEDQGGALMLAGQDAPIARYTDSLAVNGLARDGEGADPVAVEDGVNEGVTPGLVERSVLCVVVTPNLFSGDVFAVVDVTEDVLLGRVGHPLLGLAARVSCQLALEVVWRSFPAE